MLIYLPKDSAGITYSMFSQNGDQFYRGFRNSNSKRILIVEIECWDIRKSNELLYEINRSVTTNQVKLK